MTPAEVKEQAALLLCIAAAEDAPMMRGLGEEYGFSADAINLAWSTWCAEPGDGSIDTCNTGRLAAAERLFVEAYS